MTRLGAALGTALGLALGGAVTGLASVGVHGRWWGLPLLVLASLAGVLALPARWRTRLPFALGWSLVVLVASQPRPEGDRPVGADGPGWVLLALAGVLPVLALVTTAAARAPHLRGHPEGHGTGT